MLRSSSVRIARRLLQRHFQRRSRTLTTITPIESAARSVELFSISGLRCKSTAAAAAADTVLEDISMKNEKSDRLRAEIHRVRHLRNVGVFAHVDHGKTTVTERMLALAGVVRRAGSVDDGNTVTDFLPAERERGITIQSAAVTFEWGWHNNRTGNDVLPNDKVTISLIDTPGHVDFSVEVNRSVAVLDGALLVVDASSGVQAQTETVWRAMTRPSVNNHDATGTISPIGKKQQRDHGHEPLPCLALVNKMDKEGSNFGSAIKSLREKLPGANPIAIQVPLFRSLNESSQGVVAVSPTDCNATNGDFIGVVDIIHMRAVIWSHEGSAEDVEKCVPDVAYLIDGKTGRPLDPDCRVTQVSLDARRQLIEFLAEIDDKIEERYLNEQEPSNAEIRLALRQAVLSHAALPVLASAALRGRGIEPVLDAIADLLPSPLDRMAPSLSIIDESGHLKPNALIPNSTVTLGHPLHPSLLALAFKVVHMKGRGGSGEGRVVFARVYSGELRDKDVVQVVSSPALGENAQNPRIERVGGMLELSGGRFGPLREGICKSGEVCALIGLKSVVTGDTIVNVREKSKKKDQAEAVCLTGVLSPKPVLTVRLETESTSQESRLKEALSLLTVEDPSLVVEITESSILLSGLGELHIEVTLDRLMREHGLHVLAGPPAVAYRESLNSAVETPGLVAFDKTLGGTRLQAAVHLRLTPTWNASPEYAPCMMLNEPILTVSERVKEFFGLDLNAADDDLSSSSELFQSLVQGCQGALRRGPNRSLAMANVKCHIVDVNAEDSVQLVPGALRAAGANAVSSVLLSNKDSCIMLEPTMSIEVSLPGDMVGTVLSDLTSRRGTVDEVVVGEETTNSKALIRGSVPLVEILGYANSLRSLTAGEGIFTAEYKGHSPSSG